MSKATVKGKLCPMPPVVPKKSKKKNEEKDKEGEEEQNPEVRRAFDWLGRESEKLSHAESQAGGRARIKTSSNAGRAVSVLVEARVSFEQLHKEQAALATLASYILPGATNSDELRAAVVALLAKAAVADNSLGDGENGLGEGTKKRTGFAATEQHTEFQSLLGITYKVIASVLAMVKSSRGGGLQVDAFDLLTSLLHANEETQTESVRCDIVAVATQKMAAGDDPIGQVAAAGCLLKITTSQGLALMLDTHSLDPMCKMLRSHAESVKIAAVGALALFQARPELQPELEKLKAFEIIIQLLYEPSPPVIASAMYAIQSFLKLRDKAEEHIERQRRYAELAVQQDTLKGVLHVGLHIAHDEEISLACLSFINFSLQMQVPDPPKVTALPVAERKKEDVLDRKSRRGLNSLTNTSASASKPETAASAPAASNTSSKPLAVQLLACKTEFAEVLVGLLSTSSVRVHKVAIELISLQMERKREFVELFAVPSICWAMSSVFARNERDESMRDKTIRTLISLVRIKSNVGSHLHNKHFKKHAARLKLQYNPPHSWVDYVAEANKASVEGDLENALKLLLEKNIDTLVRCEVLVWIRGMIRGDPRVRTMLGVSGSYVSTALTILKGDISYYPDYYKVRCLEVLADTLHDAMGRSHWIMFHPIKTFAIEYPDEDLSDAFSYFVQYLSRVLGERSAQLLNRPVSRGADSADAPTMPVSRGADSVTEESVNAVTQELIVALGYVVIGLMRCNARMQVKAAHMGLCEKALELLRSNNVVAVRRLGADILSAMCESAPSLTRFVLSIGKESEFIYHTQQNHRGSVDEKRQRFLPTVMGAIFQVLGETEAAPQQQLDAAALEGLSEKMREKKKAAFEVFCKEAQKLELKRVIDIEPLLVSSLHTLLTLCGVDLGGEVAGRLDKHWNTLRMPLWFMQSGVRQWCWIEKGVFDVLVKLAKAPSSKPTVVYMVLRLLCVMCDEKKGRPVSMPHVDESQRITDSGLVLGVLQQLDNSTSAVSPVHSSAMNLVVALVSKVPYAPYLDKVGQRFASVIRDAVVSQAPHLRTQRLSTIESLAHCHPALRAPFYRLQGVETLYACLNLKDDEESVFGAQAMRLLAVADAQADYGPEIDVNFTTYYTTDASTKAIRILVQLAQMARVPKHRATYLSSIGALGRNNSLSTVIEGENGLFVLVHALSAEQARVVAAAGMALADMCTHPSASSIRSKIKKLGALPCVVSLMSSPDNLLQEALCVFLATAGQDGNLRLDLGKLDAVGHVHRVLDCTSCSAVQAAAILSLGNLVQSTTSAKRFMQLGIPDILHKALESSSAELMRAAAFAVASISSRVDSDVSTVFADIRNYFYTKSCYHYLLDIIRDHQKHKDVEVTVKCMRVFEAFCHPSSSIDSEFITSAVKIMKARTEDTRPSTQNSGGNCPHAVWLAAMTVCSALSKYASDVERDVCQWLVSGIKTMLLSDKIADKSSACLSIRGVWWNKKCKDALSQRPQDLDLVYEMLKDSRTRPFAAGALEELIEGDDSFATGIVSRGYLHYIYLLLQSSSAQEVTQAAQTLSSMCKRAASLQAVIAEIPSQKKKEGIKPIIDVMDVHDAPDLKVACAKCISEVVRLRKWTLKVTEDSCQGLMRMLQHTNEHVVLGALSTFTTIAKHRSTHSVLLQQGAIINLNALLTDRIEKMREGACAVIKQLARSQECNDLMLRIGTAKNLLDMMRKDTFFMVCRSGETMYSMLTNANAQSEFICLNGMEVIEMLLEAQETEIRKMAGSLLLRLLGNPRNKANFKKSPLFLKSLEHVKTDADMDVRRSLCEALNAFAGNQASVNTEFKTALYGAGFMEALLRMLQDTRIGNAGVKTRTIAAKSLANICSILSVQNDIQSMGFIDVLVSLLQSKSAEEVEATTRVIARAVRYHVPNRQSACRAGLVKVLANCIKWQPEPDFESSAEGSSKPPPLPNKDRIKMSTAHVGAAAMDALCALLECPDCRRTYQGTRSVDITIQGSSLEMPSIIKLYDCPHREVCLACAQDASECKILDMVIDMLSAPEDMLRNSSAQLLGALAIGVPCHGQCDLSNFACKQVLERGALKSLIKMLCAKDAFDMGRAAAEQFAAARAIDSLATHDKIRYVCCKSGFIKALVDMLFSTLGRIKGSAALALARLCASEHLHFFYNTMTQKTYWDQPDDLTFAIKLDESREYFAPEDVVRDVVRSGYWVRGLFKPFERVNYCDMLVDCQLIKHGQRAGMHTMKADNTIVTMHSVLDLILDIFKSPIYDSEVNGWAAEACAIVSEFHVNRQHIALSGCIPDIVALLYSNHSLFKEQAAVGLGILMYHHLASEIAAGAGVIGAFTEILLSPYSTKTLKESAALGMSKACWNAANQVLAMRSGAIMPLIGMLMSPEIRQWSCAVEALMCMSNNDECRTAIGQAGAIPPLVNKLTLEGAPGETPAQVRLLATLTNVLSIPANCDRAVDCGVLMRFISLTHSHDPLLHNFLLIAVAEVLRCVRWRKRFVDCGLVQVLLMLIHRYANDRGLHRQQDRPRSAKDTNNQPGLDPRAALIRILLGGMLRDLSDGEEFKTSMVHLGAFSALKILAMSPENEAQACAAETVGNLAFSDEFKEQVRLDGLIPCIAHLSRKRCLEVQLQSARTLRVLASTHKNKLALVEAGAVHGLRDMLDQKCPELRIRATAALSLLATNADNGAALSKAGAVRPLVNLLDESDPNVIAGAARVLAEVTKTEKLDTRLEVAAWGAIPKLSAALDGQTDERITLQVARTINNMTAAEMLTSKAAKQARSYMMVDQRIGLIQADATAKKIRQEMLTAGIASKLKPLAEMYPNPEINFHAQRSLAQIQGQRDL